MNTIYFMLSLIYTRQLFHYIRDNVPDKIHDKCIVLNKRPQITDINKTVYMIDTKQRFFKTPTFIKNIQMNNDKFWLMLLTVFI